MTTDSSLNHDYYQILGVDRHATTADIKIRFRTLAKRVHPDKSECPDAGEVFRRCREAYDTIIDPIKRRRYDGLLAGAPAAVNAVRKSSATAQPQTPSPVTPQKSSATAQPEAPSPQKSSATAQPKTPNPTNPYRIELARSNRSSCNRCKNKIEKGALRFGSNIEGSSYDWTSWRHVQCVTAKQVANMDKAGGINATAGIAELTTAQQHEFLMAIEAIRNAGGNKVTRSSASVSLKPLDIVLPLLERVRARAAARSMNLDAS